MKLEIVVHPYFGSLDELRRLLESQQGWHDSGIELRSPLRLRAEPTVLIAVVGAAGVGIGALINGLLAIAQQWKARRVVIEGRHGERLELPADTPPDKVDYWIRKLREIDAKRILL